MLRLLNKEDSGIFQLIAFLIYKHKNLDLAIDVPVFKKIHTLGDLEVIKLS